MNKTTVVNDEIVRGAEKSEADEAPAKAFVNPDKLWTAELAYSLMELYPELTAQGYSLNTISKIMRGRDTEIVLSFDEMQTVLETKLGLS